MILIRNKIRTALVALNVMLLAALPLQPSAQTDPDQAEFDRKAQKELETVLASALVLTDSQAVTFGVLSFDPNRYLPGSGNRLGSQETISRRRGIKVFNLPLRWTLSDEEKSLRHIFKTRLSLLELEQTIDFGDEGGEGTEDPQTTRVFAIYSGYKALFDWTPHWRLEGEVGLNLQRYDNNFAYNSTISQTLSADVDGLLFNNSATALEAVIKGGVVYSSETETLPWSWRSSYAYYQGTTVETSRTLPEAEPRVWRFSNGASVKKHLPEWGGRKNRLRFTASRIDVRGDAVRTFNTDHYYRVVLGWLIQSPRHFDWLDNMGASVAVNFGSALSGGTLQLLYNETF